MKMRKIIATIMVMILVLGSCITFSACSDGKEHDETNNGLVCISKQHEFIGIHYDQYVLYDPDTLVMYSMITGGDEPIFTVLYNADGTLKLYNSTSE